MSVTLKDDGVVAAKDETTHAAFFYGTLMAPEVFFTVCFRQSKPPPDVVKAYAFRTAVLHGYCRRRVRYADYPGIVEDPDHEVRGTYVAGLTAANVAKLDWFEGNEYERRTVKLRLLDRVGDDKGEGNVEGDEVEAQVYVFKSREALEDREWDFEEFRRDRLKLWSRADYVFEDCDPTQPATVVSTADESKQNQQS